MKLYNTLTRSVEEIKPLAAPKVTIYTCGPTVYDYPHIGNWFTFIRYDLLVRALKANGLGPVWVMNITDVGHLVSDADDGEDKLEKGARREGKTAWDVAKFYGDYFVEGLKRLNISAPNFLPKATEHIAEQIELIKTLEEKGFTYVIDDGVYYDTSKFEGYEALARLDLDDQQAGARVAFNAQKHNSSDFALWKFSPKGQKRDMEWDSPWGKGFPGWHIECSAMSKKYLGDTLDIHAGGIDHLPVHHTNEIAQSEAATGKRFANYWMHTNHVLIDGDKISKSLGNGITLEDIEKQGYSLEVLRVLVLQSHYRTQSKLNDASLLSAYARLTDLQKFAQLCFQPNVVNEKYGRFSVEDVEYARQDLLNAMNDDLATPKVMSMLSEYDRNIRRDWLKDQAAFKALRELIEFVDDLLGLSLTNQSDLTKEQRELIQKEDMLWRKAKNGEASFADVDEIKKKLMSHHIVVSNFNDSKPLWLRTGTGRKED
ncbi:MAG TPA: cysteine--tRNA ligase [Candidatus Saccharimonadales bacterium]